MAKRAVKADERRPASRARGRAAATSPARRGAAAPKGGRRAAPAPPQRPAKRRAARSTILLRWCAVGALAFVAFLYYRPLVSYLETRGTVAERQSEVAELKAERARLQARLERSTGLDAVAREARHMSLVRPGERLFIVRGVKEWRRAQRATIADGDG